MASLPQGWDSDYDGARWYFIYKPTGLVQYHFPKPGDEFPEFFDSFAPTPSLAPEERLESQQQVKRQNTTSRQNRRQRGASSANNKNDAGDEEGGLEFSFESFGYLGPGGYSDVSPLDGEEDGIGGGRDEKSRSRGREDSAGGSRISPMTSAGTTPLGTKSEPARGTPAMGESIVEELPGHDEAGVPMLDGKAVEPQPFNPVGFVAELVSDSTAQCNEELNPPPVELPDNAIASTPVQPAGYVNAHPVELSAVERTPASQPAQAQREVASSTSPQPPLQQGFKITRKPTAAGAKPGKYQPWSPAKRPSEEDTKRASVIGNVSIRDTQIKELGLDPRRFSVPLAPAKVDPTDVPAILQPPQLSSRDPFDSSLSKTQDPSGLGSVNDALRIPGSGARHESISVPPGQQPGPPGLSHFPSVLKPGSRQSQPLHLMKQFQPEQKPYMAWQAEPQPTNSPPATQPLNAHPFPGPASGPSESEFHPSPLRPGSRTLSTGPTQPHIQASHPTASQSATGATGGPTPLTRTTTYTPYSPPKDTSGDAQQTTQSPSPSQSARADDVSVQAPTEPKKYQASVESVVEGMPSGDSSLQPQSSAADMPSPDPSSGSFTMPIISPLNIRKKKQPTAADLSMTSTLETLPLEQEAKFPSDIQPIPGRTEQVSGPDTSSATKQVDVLDATAQANTPLQVNDLHNPNAPVGSEHAIDTPQLGTQSSLKGGSQNPSSQGTFIMGESIILPTGDESTSQTPQDNEDRQVERGEKTHTLDTSQDTFVTAGDAVPGPDSSEARSDLKIEHAHEEPTEESMGSIENDAAQKHSDGPPSLIQSPTPSISTVTTDSMASEVLPATGQRQSDAPPIPMSTRPGAAPRRPSAAATETASTAQVQDTPSSAAPSLYSLSPKPTAADLGLRTQTPLLGPRPTGIEQQDSHAPQHFEGKDMCSHGSHSVGGDEPTVAGHMESLDQELAAPKPTSSATPGQNPGFLNPLPMPSLHTGSPRPGQLAYPPSGGIVRKKPVPSQSSIRTTSGATASLPTAQGLQTPAPLAQNGDNPVGYGATQPPSETSLNQNRPLSPTQAPATIQQYSPSSTTNRPSSVVNPQYHPQSHGVTSTQGAPLPSPPIAPEQPQIPQPMQSSGFSYFGQPSLMNQSSTYAPPAPPQTGSPGLAQGPSVQPQAPVNRPTGTPSPVLQRPGSTVSSASMPGSQTYQQTTISPPGHATMLQGQAGSPHTQPIGQGVNVGYSPYAPAVQGQNQAGYGLPGSPAPGGNQATEATSPPAQHASATSAAGQLVNTAFAPPPGGILRAEAKPPPDQSMASGVGSPSQPSPQPGIMAYNPQTYGAMPSLPARQSGSSQQFGAAQPPASPFQRQQGAQTPGVLGSLPSGTNSPQQGYPSPSFQPPPTAGQPGGQQFQAPPTYAIGSATPGTTIGSSVGSTATNAKKWMSKMWKNQAVKKTAFAVGGAIIGEGLGVGGQSGMEIGANLHNWKQSQQKPKPQQGFQQIQQQLQQQQQQTQQQALAKFQQAQQQAQQQTMATLQHIQSAPPQLQGLPTPGGRPQSVALPQGLASQWQTPSSATQAQATPTPGSYTPSPPPHGSRPPGPQIPSAQTPGSSVPSSQVPGAQTQTPTYPYPGSQSPPVPNQGWQGQTQQRGVAGARPPHHYGSASPPYTSGSPHTQSPAGTPPVQGASIQSLPSQQQYASPLQQQPPTLAQQLHEGVQDGILSAVQNQVSSMITNSLSSNSDQRPPFNHYNTAPAGNTFQSYMNQTQQPNSSFGGSSSSFVPTVAPTFTVPIPGVDGTSSGYGGTQTTAFSTDTTGNAYFAAPPTTDSAYTVTDTSSFSVTDDGQVLATETVSVTDTSGGGDSWTSTTVDYSGNDWGDDLDVLI